MGFLVLRPMLIGNPGAGVTLHTVGRDYPRSVPPSLWDSPPVFGIEFADAGRYTPNGNNRAGRVSPRRDREAGPGDLHSSPRQGRSRETV